jgi:hypothetical protein
MVIIFISVNVMRERADGEGGEQKKKERKKAKRQGGIESITARIDVQELTVVYEGT